MDAMTLSPVPEGKRCTKCGNRFDLESFHYSKGTRDKRTTWCRDCTNKHNRERVYPIQTEGTRRCTSCREVKPRTEFYARPNSSDGRKSICIECDRWNVNARKYGLTRGKFYGLLWAQGNRCAACRAEEPPPERGRALGWHIDHDHVTGKVRGILCRFCNTALGLAQEDAARLRALAEYIEACEQNESSVQCM